MAYNMIKKDIGKNVLMQHTPRCPVFDDTLGRDREEVGKGGGYGGHL